ncbi:hypothetical protein DRE_06039 [Drechslerella stenobrocha 248]|uniref:glucan endo-1,3-beta-D-glucosidase n=1 Tax=Drechslerella stenobrocha 248 TaxID=1043628 RepID=W7HMD8_9PEZI|nr:hypothetical protein DRE_06039 [Drechslerella stenobrocha 248]
MPYVKAVFLGAVLAMGQLGAADYGINGGMGKAVKVMQYPGVGCTGTFKNPILSQDASGACKVDYKEHSYSGPLAPLNNQITFHVRGPIKLFNFAAYYPSDPPPREKRDLPHHHRRSHYHEHVKRKAKKVKTEVKEELVTVTKYAGPKPTGGAQKPVKGGYSATGGSGKYFKKIASYDSAKKVCDNVTFMNNKGDPQLSGDWTKCFGNSESFMSADGKSASAKPQCLAPDTLFGVNEEFSIWTGDKCSQDEIAYSGNACRKGWDGDNKVFVFKFTMPIDNSPGSNSNMPAVWSLNSLIGRTLQYPAKPEWSCWSTGCGEFDIFEVLAGEGEFSNAMTSHLHSFQGSPMKGSPNAKGGGGTPDFFKRPVTGTFTGMVSYLSDGAITIQQLDEGFDFPEYLPMDTIKKGMRKATKANVYA